MAPRKRKARLVGILSDTHDRLRPEALAALAGCDLIFHAGDVCRKEILEELARVAPVLAVRGNNDRGAWAKRLPRSRRVEVEGCRFFLIHDAKEIDDRAKLSDIDVVVSGHSHRPRLERVGGVLYVNPGSAGPRRFSLPVSLARLSLGSRGPRARIVDLLPDG